jgi:hypothetical protein
MATGLPLTFPLVIRTSVIIFKSVIFILLIAFKPQRIIKFSPHPNPLSTGERGLLDKSVYN